MFSKSETIQLTRTLIPRREIRWPVFTLFWITLGILSAIHWWYLFFGNQPYEWWVLFRAKLIVWTMWGAVTPFILEIGAKYRIEKPVVARNLGFLFGFSILISAVYICLYSATIYWNFPSDFASAPPTFWRLTHWIYWNHFTYFYLGFWIVVAIEQMIGFAVRSHKREIVSKELQRQLTEARLSQLKGQIHPHFLFNTLSAISSLIAESKKDNAFDVVTRLSHLLRMGLQHGEKQYSSLSEELEFSREYLELMSVRYPDNLTFEIMLAPKSEKALVPSLILQPLVENAVKHGIKSGGDKTNVKIATSVNHDWLTVSIANSNNNSPIDIEKAANNLTSPGLGLKITHERLQHLFGSDYELNFNQSDDKMTSLNLILPLQYDSDSADRT